MGNQLMEASSSTARATGRPPGARVEMLAKVGIAEPEKALAGYPTSSAAACASAS